MTYLCVKCRIKWTIGKPTSHPSGGLCDACITSYIRYRQKRAGFHDCFRRNVELCSRKDCAYWDLCNRAYVAGEVVHDEPV